jgi:hypothetical protein
MSHKINPDFSSADGQSLAKIKKTGYTVSVVSKEDLSVG